MPTSFPGSLDALVNPTAADTKDSATVPHAGQHANANDAIEALEAKVGVDGSAVTTSLDYHAKVALPKGVLGYSTATVDQTGISTETDLTGLSKAVTVGTGRLVVIEVQVNAARTVADGYTVVRIKEGTTVIQEAFVTPGLAGVAQTFGFSCAPLTPTAGAHTYKVSLARGSGTGTINSNASATALAFILVEDIGKA